MAEKVTVDKPYFDALLRRADFHTSTLSHGRADAASVTISRVEYDSLLRISREYEALKCALYAGGVTAETLHVLISGASNSQRKDSGHETYGWTPVWADQTAQDVNQPPRPTNTASCTGMPWRQPTPAPSFNLTTGNGPFTDGHKGQYLDSANVQIGKDIRNINYGVSAPSVNDDVGLEEDDGFVDGALDVDLSPPVPQPSQDRRTLFFSGLPDRVTYRDLLSVIKGGKLLSINIRRNHATVSFWDGANEYLAWSKRNDVYIHSKRIEIRWADRQFKVNDHVSNKVVSGVTRNILIRHARAAGLTENQIREDMEHIHNLIIIDIVFRDGDAYVSTNSVHNALFARTCMMSRTAYKACKVGFSRDECDVPLPALATKNRLPSAQPPARKRPVLANRFGLLGISDGENSSDEENRASAEEVTDDDGSPDAHPRGGARLDPADVECP